MKTKTFKVPIYGQTITLIQVDGKDDADAIVPILKNHKLTQEHIDDVLENISKGVFNGGDTFRNFQIERLLVVFYVMKTPYQRANVYSHEKRHLEDRILEWANINDIEASAFLAGFLGEKFFEFQKEKE